MTKQETLPKGVGVSKFDFTKTFRNQLFSRVRILYYQFSITNHSESTLKSKIMSILQLEFIHLLQNKLYIHYLHFIQQRLVKK